MIKIRRKYKRQGGIVIKKLVKMMKPFDVIIIFLLVALSFSPMAIFAVQNSQNEGNKIYAVISIDGEEHKLITYYPAPGQYNIIEIDGERIRNKEDNSPQQISVKTGWIQSPGETSLNIPHRLLIEIISENPEDTEIDVIS
ncbi:NusG domain II-containing protein [Enterococcus aquimarinus]